MTKLSPRAEKNLKAALPNAEELIREQMKKAPAGGYTSEEFKNLPRQIIEKFGGDAESLREMGIDVPANSPSSEDLIRNQMMQAPAGTFSAKDLAERPAEIIKKYGGDAQALMDMGINLNLPNPVQQFDGVHVNLAKYPSMYQRFVELAGTEKHQGYQNQNAEEAIRDTLQHDNFFASLGTDEKQAAVDGIINDYSELAKGKLKAEFPVLLQEIDAQKNQTN